MFVVTLQNTMTGNNKKQLPVCTCTRETTQLRYLKQIFHPLRTPSHLDCPSYFIFLNTYRSYGLMLVSPQNSYAEILSPNVMVREGGALGGDPVVWD